MPSSKKPLKKKKKQPTKATVPHHFSAPSISMFHAEKGDCVAVQGNP